MNSFKALSFFSTVLSVVFAVTGEAASAPSGEREKPMRIVVVHNDAPGCEPDCDMWISAEGEMVAGTPAEFRRALKSLGSRRPPVFVSSGGGNVDAAMEIGRLVRARGLDVAVSKTEFSETPSESAPSGKTRAQALSSGKPARAAPKPARGRPRSRQAYCASACTLVLAAGRRRFVAPAAHVGVHEIVIPEQTVMQTARYYRYRILQKGDRIISKETISVEEKHIPRHFARSKPSPAYYRKVRDYLAEMGESREIIDLMKTTPPEKIRWLTRTELASTGLATEERGAETLVAAPPPPQAPTRTAEEAGTGRLSTYDRFRNLANVPAPERSAVKTDTVATYSRLQSLLRGSGAAEPLDERAAPRPAGFAAAAGRGLTPVGLWGLIGVGIGSLLAIGSFVARLRRRAPTVRAAPTSGPKPE